MTEKGDGMIVEGRGMTEESRGMAGVEGRGMTRVHNRNAMVSYPGAFPTSRKGGGGGSRAMALQCYPLSRSPI
jgi:hypothetical protein